MHSHPDLDTIELETDGLVIARRNFQLGLWAGMRLGFRGERLARYAREIMDEDYREPGPGDVVTRIRSDFELNGVDYPPDMILAELKRTEAQVRRAFLATD